MPIYEVDKELYNIPDDKVQGFESQYPTAKVKMTAGGKGYTIPLSQRDKFRQQYKDAAYTAPPKEYTARKEQEAAAEAERQRQEEYKGRMRMRAAEAREKNMQGEVEARYGAMSPYSVGERLQGVFDSGKMDVYVNADEERQIDNAFKPKTPESENDVLENYLARFAMTQKGQDILSQDKGQDEIQQEFSDAMFNRYGRQIQRDVTDFNKGKTVNDVNTLLTGIDNQLREKNRQLSALAPSDARSALMQSDRYNREAAPLRKEVSTLESAQRLVEDAQRIMTEAKNPSSNFLQGVYRGTKDNLSWESWTFGMADMADSNNLLDALKKTEEGKELTPAETALIDASLLNMATHAYYDDELGAGYKAGQVTAESLPFMLEFIANPISSSGKVIAKRLLKYGIKKFGKAMMKRNAAKIGARLAGDLAAATGMAATTGQARVLGGAQERIIQGYDYGRDDAGQLYAKGGDVSVGEALGRSALSTIIENQSEMIFNAFRGAGDVLRRAGIVDLSMPKSGIIKKLSESGAGKVLREIRTNPTIREVAERTQFRGLPEEYFEEVYNNFASVAIGDMSVDEALDLDNNIDTFVGLVPTSMAFGALGLAGLAKERMSNSYRRRKAFGNMTKEQQAKYAELEQMATQPGNEDIKAFIRYTIADESLSQEEKRNEIEYLFELVKGNAIQDMATEATEQDAAYEQGATAEDKNRVKLQLDDAEERLVSKGYDVTTGNLEADAQTDADVAAYVNAQAQMDGMVDKAQADIDAQVDNVQRVAESNIGKDGRVIEATTPTGEKVFVKDGNVLQLDDVSYKAEGSVIVAKEDGTQEMVDGKNLTITNVMDGQTYVDNAVTTTRDALEQQAANEIEGVLQFAVGDIYNIQTPEGVRKLQVLGTDNLGNVVISMGGEPETMTRADIQQMAQLAKQPMRKQTDSGYMQRVSEQDGIVSADVYDTDGNVVDNVETPVSQYYVLPDYVPIQPQTQPQQAVQEEQTVQAEAVPETPTAEVQGDTEGKAEQPETVAEQKAQTEGDGNVRYDMMNVNDAISDIYNAQGLTPEEADQFVEANIAQAESNAKAIEEEAPKMGTDLAKYKQDKAEWQARYNEANRMADFWRNVRDTRLAQMQPVEEVQEPVAEVPQTEQAEQTQEAVTPTEETIPVEEQPTAEVQPEITPQQEAIAQAEAEVNTNPTEAQKEAGNYKKGHIRIDGYDITIEQPKGSVRSGVDENGNRWETKMNNTYGYIRGTESVDGDHIDVFLSDNPTEGNVYVVDQINQKTGEFDEHKVMYGFGSMQEAIDAYLSNYSEGWKIGTVTDVSKDEFKKWINSSKRKTKPFSEYVSVKTIAGQNEGATEPVQQPTEKPNRLVSEERYEELKKRMKAKLRGQMNMGIDPEILTIGIEMAVYHIEKGARKFTEYAKNMIADLGDDIRPYLKAFYNGARDLPEMSGFEMDSYDTVSSIDVANFDKETVNAMQAAEIIAREQEVEAEIKSATGDLKGRFVSNVSDALGEEKLNVPALRKMANDIGLNADDILIQELTELAIINKAKDIVTNGGFNKETYNEIVKLYESQPTISMRSSGRVEKQQYSTPIPISYLADMFVMEGQPTSVLEPSAGNGMMVFGIPSGMIHANDIDSNRLDNLRKQGFSEITSQDALLPFAGKYDAVVTNPPFGSLEAKDFGGYLISGLEKQMSINALDSMNDNGRAAIVIGGNTEYKENGSIKGAEKAYFNYLYNNYNVVDVINISGDLYAKQGTKYPVRLILINGRKTIGDERYAPVKSKARAEQITTFDELFDRVNNENVLPIQESTVSDGNREQQPDSRRSDNEQVDSGGRQQPEARDKSDRRSTGGATRERVSDTEERTSDAGERRDEPVQGDNGSRMDADAVGKSERGKADRSRTGELVGNIAGRTDTAGVFEALGDVDRKPVEINIENEKTHYPAQSKSTEIGSVVPTNTVQAIEDVLGRFGDIDAYVQEKLGYESKEELFKALSAEQIDSVALAISQMENGQGFIIGDMTGVGKGRQAAALIRYAVNNGYKPIFMTEKANLFSDIYRDLRDIGSPELVPFIVNDKGDSDPSMTDEAGNVVYKVPSKSVKQKAYNDKELPEGYDYVVITYSQLSTSDKKPNPKKDFFGEIAKENILIMDESHNAGGTGNTGLFLQKVLPTTAGVTFLSGTFAKRADNMPIYAIKTNMSDANMSQEDLINAIMTGGVPLQEIMSRNLVESGQMIRRERDYTGVTIDWLQMEGDTEKQKTAFNKIIEIFNDLIRFQRDYIDPIIDGISEELAEIQGEAGNTKGTKDLGISNTPFASKTFNLVRQLLFALKADYVADRAIMYAGEGLKPVIAVSNTMEGFIKDEMVADEDVENPDFSITLRKGLDGLFRYTEKKGNGISETKLIPLSDLSKEGQKRYYELLDKINDASSGLSISPIDVIKNKVQRAGYSIGELTGREFELQYNDDGTVRKVKRSDKDKKKLMRDFNNGELDMLILNQSASTGISLHASTKFKDQRQRVMIFAQNQLDVNTEVQMRGRTDRTGQVHRSKYEYIVSPIPAEGRLMMMFKSKLKSLDANTTSSQKSKINEMQIVDFLNKYGDQVVVDYLKENIELVDKLLDPLHMEDMKEEDIEKMKASGGEATKVAGRVALLNVDEQEQFYKDIAERYNTLINYLNETGTNDLEITTLPLNAKTISKEVIVPGKDPDGENAFADNSYLEQVEVDVLKKPMTAKEVKENIDKFTEGKSATQYRDFLISKVDEYEASQLEKVRSEYSDVTVPKMNELIQKERERIMKNKKLDEEKKAELIAKKTDDITAKYQGQLERKENAVRYKMQIFRQVFSNLPVGRTLLIPNSLSSEGQDTGLSYGMLIGYKMSEKMSPSTTTAVFATLDGRRKMEIPLSRAEYIQSIISSTLMNIGEASSITLDNWDEKIPNKTRKNSYIITGNVLQAYGTTSGGQLVTYSTDNGEFKQGILLPDSFKKTDIKRREPISIKYKDILNGEAVTDSTKEVTFSKAYGTIYIYVPQSKRAGGKYYLDKNMQKFVVGGNFIQRGNKFQAEVPEANLKKMLDYMSKTFGTSVSVQALSGDNKETGMRFRSMSGQMFAPADRTVISQSATDLASKLNTPIRIVNSIDELSDAELRQVDMQHRAGRRVAGWYQQRTDEVVIFLPDVKDVEDVKKTILHEVVGHKGMKELFGDEFDNFLLDVFTGANETVRGEISQRMSRNGWNAALATEEYLAELAETEPDVSLWDRVVVAFKKMLRKFGIDMSVSNRELRYLLKQSYDNRVTSGVMRDAQRVANEYTMRTGVYSPENEDIRYRDKYWGDNSSITFKRYPVKSVSSAIAKYLEDNNIEYNREVATTGSTYYEFETDGATFNIRLSNHTQRGYDSGDNVYVSISKDGEIYGIEINSVAENVLLSGDIKSIIEEARKFNTEHAGKKSPNNPMQDITREKFPYLYDYIEDEIMRDVRDKEREALNNYIASNIQYPFVASNGSEVQSNGDVYYNGERLTKRNGKEMRDEARRELENRKMQLEEDFEKSKSGIRFRSLPSTPQGIAQQYYEEGVTGQTSPEQFKFLNMTFTKPSTKKFMADIEEAWFDYMRSVRIMQEAIEKETGEKIKDSENVYLQENANSSVNKIELEQIENSLVQPLVDILKKVSKAAGTDIKGIEQYLNSVHGIERNEYMYRREREKLIQSKKDAYDKEVKDAQDKGEDIPEQPSFEPTKKEEKKLRRDYSGLTSIYETDKVLDAENEARNYIAEFEGKVGDDMVKDLWGKIKALTDFALEKEYKSGLISKELYDNISGMYQNYVPLRGFDETTAGDVYNYYMHNDYVLQSTVKTAQGRKSRAADIIANILNMAQSSVIRGNKNVVKQALLNLAVGKPTSLLTVGKVWYEKSASGEIVPVPMPVLDGLTPDEQRQAIEDFEADMKNKAKKGLVFLRRASFDTGLRTTKAEKMEHGVKVYRNGREFVVYVNGNPKAAQAINGLLNDDSRPSKAKDIISKLNRTHAALLTSFNVEFIPANLVRDVLSSNLTTLVKDGVKYTVRFNKNLKDNISLVNIKGAKAGRYGGIFNLYKKYKDGTLDLTNERERYFDEFLKNGGETGFTQMLSVEDLNNKLVKDMKKGNVLVNANKVLLNATEYVNRGIENSCRFAAYMTSRQMGKSVLQSIADAKDVSVNFNRKGSGAMWNRYFRLGWIFINAGVQGTVKFAKLFKKYPKKMYPIMAAIIGLGLASGIVWGLYGAAGGDDDENSGYYDLSPYVRRSNFVVKGGKGYISIPLPHEIKALYGIGQIAASEIMGYDKYENKAAAIVTQLSTFFPIDFVNAEGFIKYDDSFLKGIARGLTPTLFGYFADAYILEEDFAGRKIGNRTEWNKAMPEYLRGSKNTPEFYSYIPKWWNRLTGGSDFRRSNMDTPAFNPSSLEYLVNSYFGGPMKVFNKSVKTLEMMFGDEDFDAYNIPVVNRFFKYSSGGAEQKRTITDGYYYYRGEYELIDSEISSLKKSDNAMQVAERVAELEQNGDLRKWGIMKDAENAVREINKAIRQAPDKETEKDLYVKRREIMKMAVEAIEKNEVGMIENE